MKITLLLALTEQDYAEHLSFILSEKYADTFDVNVCTSSQALKELLQLNHVHILLCDAQYITSFSPTQAQVTCLLWSHLLQDSEEYARFRRINKYQRISSLVSSLLEAFAEAGGNTASFQNRDAHITAVWSPQGGVGKTTVALAYAVRKALDGKRVVYLNLEHFCSTSAYFPTKGKSISSIFEKLHTDVSMHIASIRQQDTASGLFYFCAPDNYDDMNILTPEDVETLLNACKMDVQELVVDLSDVCDSRTQMVFSCADTVFLVSDPSLLTQMKIQQFMTQHNIAQNLSDKLILVANKGGKIPHGTFRAHFPLPLVQSTDPISVYKTLSGNSFEW